MLYIININSKWFVIVEFRSILELISVLAYSSLRTHQRTRYSIRALDNSSALEHEYRSPITCRQVYIAHLSIMKKVGRSTMGKELRTCPTAISLIPAGPWSTGLAWFSFLINSSSSHRSLYSASPILHLHRPLSSPLLHDEKIGPLDRYDRSREARILVSLFLSSRRNRRFEMSIIFLVRLAVRSMGAKWRHSSRGIFRKYRYQRGFYWTSLALRLRFRGERAGAPLFPRLFASLCIAAVTTSRLLKATELVEPVWWGVVILAARREDRNWFVSHRASSFRPVWLHPIGSFLFPFLFDFLAAGLYPLLFSRRSKLASDQAV